MKIKMPVLLLSIILLAACSTTKVERSSQKGLKGDWILASITNEQGNTVQIKELFNQAPPACFLGSNWTFISNNNSGTYTFQEAGCDAATHSIKWFMEENDSAIYFLWKFIPEGVKAKDVKAGYQLKLLSESETEFVLEQEASFEGDIIAVHYHFVRN